uniref:putative uncharacterized protein DDB_G0286901 n=1 Tax=Erigeron canadensis TaxID=72917 RepID=UPI001CB88B3E|nr:putative uncharacterized protein DDB_G0286901 [Erigeron canadensis]
MSTSQNASSVVSGSTTLKNLIKHPKSNNNRNTGKAIDGSSVGHDPLGLMPKEPEPYVDPFARSQVRTTLRETNANPDVASMIKGLQEQLETTQSENLARFDILESRMIGSGSQRSKSQEVRIHDLEALENSPAINRSVNFGGTNNQGASASQSLGHLFSIPPAKAGSASFFYGGNNSNNNINNNNNEQTPPSSTINPGLNNSSHSYENNANGMQDNVANAY